MKDPEFHCMAFPFNWQAAHPPPGRLAHRAGRLEPSALDATLQKLCSQATSHLWLDLKVFVFDKRRALAPWPFRAGVKDLKRFRHFEKMRSSAVAEPPAADSTFLRRRLKRNVPMMQTGKLIILLGVGLVVIGLIVWGLGRAGFRGLPGDIRYESDRVHVYFPIMTCLLLSVLLTFALWLWQWWSRR
jgi:hypothetical protein